MPLVPETAAILLVDDDAASLEMLAGMIGALGRVVTATTGEEAVDQARELRPLVVLVNVVLPGIDGYETCRRIKDDPGCRDAAVILMCPSRDAIDRRRGFDAGAVDFIAQPFMPNEVIECVQKHLTIRRDLRQSDAEFPATGMDLRDEAPARDQGDVDIPEPAFKTGDVLASRFRIVSYLARGGMGELYEAEDLELREHVALKTILSTAADERSVALFKREVHLARQVTHPNVCRIYDVYRHRPADARDHAHEVMFLAMELLSGETLAERLHRMGRMETTDILPIAKQMAAALAAAHRAGVVHRDFKTQNVMLVGKQGDPAPRVVVTDFGLARRSSSGNDASFSMSSTDLGAAISGTPQYMAPEQVEGGAVTPATDVYAFGVVLYELVTGMYPFYGDTPMKIATRRLQVPAPSPRLLVPDLDPRWELTILRCLARDPADRFASVTEAADALENASVAPVAIAGTPSAVAAAPVMAPRPVVEPGSRRWAAAAAVVGVLAIAAAGYAWYAAQRTSGVTSIAVLPFETTLKAPDQEYVADGISEALINRLSELPGIKVVANSSSSQYKGRSVDPRDVARALDVAAVLIGRVVERGDGLAVSVELVDGSDRTHLWGSQYVRTAADLMNLPDDISRDLATSLNVPQTARDSARTALSGTRNARAYELLLRGHVHRAKGSTEDRQRAGEYFRQAIEADPGYALAYADLSDIYRSLINSGQLDATEYLPRARAAAEKALELDETLADGHYALANLMTYGWEWAAAERSYKRSIELNPNLALAHRWYASYLRLMGRHDQAVAEIARARELDPLSPGVNATLAFILTSAGRYDQAREALDRTLELDRAYPYAHLYFGHLYMAEGGYDRAIASYQQAATLGLDTPPTQIALGAAYARAGQTDRARAILADLGKRTENVSPAELAVLLVALGERERALASLEEAFRVRDTHLQQLGVEPGLEPLRAEPRFRDLLQRVGLTPSATAR
jgi:serine/threonine-protein kinase